MAQGYPRVVFFLSSLQVGGAEIQTFQLVESLRRKGCDARILVHHPLAAGAIPLTGEEDHLVFLDGFRMRNPRGWLRAWRTLRQQSADVIVPVNTTPTVICWLGKALGFFRSRVVCTFHTTQLRQEEGVQFKLFRWAASAIDAVVFVSENQLDYWKGAGLRTRSHAVIHNGVNTDRYAVVQDITRHDAKRLLGLRAEDFVIGISAALRPEKNHLQLIEAVAKLRAAGLPVRLVIIGDGDERRNIEERLASLLLVDTVVMVGRQHDVRPFLAALDIGVICSTSVETFSLAALEAMSCGIPMVLSEIGGASEMVQHGRNGYLFPAGDVKALYNVLIEAFQTDLAPLREAAAADVRRRFSHESMVNRYLQLFGNSWSLHPGASAAEAVS